MRVTRTRLFIHHIDIGDISMMTAATRFHIVLSMMALVFLSAPSTSSAQERAKDIPIYQTEGLVIVPDGNGSTSSWCKQNRKRQFGSGDPSPYNFIVRYSVDHEQRENLFYPSYEEFVLGHIAPAIKKICKGSIATSENFFINFQMTNKKNRGGHGDRIWDQLTFRYRDNEVIQTRYGPAWEMIQGKSQKQIDALKLPKVLNRMDTVVAKFGPLTVYPHDYELCTRRGVEVDVTFDMAGSERDSWIASKYGYTGEKGFVRFFEKDLLPALRDKCGKRKVGGMVNVIFYERESTEFWDVIRFNVLPSGYRQSKINPVKVLASHHKGAHAKKLAELAQTEKRRAQNSCNDEPFCGLSGGDYLNAIYQNNYALIRKLDQKIIKEALSAGNMKGMQDFVAAISGNFSKDNSNVDPFGLRGTSILKIMANKYMAEYGENHYRSASGACLQEDSVSITRKYTTKVTRYENQYGLDQGSVGGDTFSEDYTVNKEFKSLCNKICDHLGEGGSYLFETRSRKAAAVFAGISQVRTKVDCNSPEVKQFERNLISLTERSLRKESTPSSSARVEDNDAQKAQDTKKANTEAVKERQAQSETPQEQNTRTPRTRTGKPQAQRNTSRQGEASRMARRSAQPVIDESVLNDLDGNLKAGEQFLTENRNNDGVIETASGLQYRILKSGSGAKPTSNNQVTAHMRGTLINGHVFSDTYSKNQPLSLTLGQLIKGVSEGLQQVNEGGKIQLFVPPSLAYGNRAAGSNIPAGSTLIYEIELIKIN